MFDHIVDVAYEGQNNELAHYICSFSVLVYMLADKLQNRSKEIPGVFLMSVTIL